MTSSLRGVRGVLVQRSIAKKGVYLPSVSTKHLEAAVPMQHLRGIAVLRTAYTYVTAHRMPSQSHFVGLACRQGPSRARCVHNELIDTGHG